jgi:SAM-dependent methyltransferase
MIRLADRQQFATVRQFLESSYAEDSSELADRVGDFDPKKHHEEAAPVRMFFLGRAVAVEEWERSAPDEVRIAFSDLGLVEPASEDRLRASVLLYRIRGVYIASDRFTDDEGVAGLPNQDCVYYALTETAQRYLQSLPDDRYGTVLDLGCGSGVAGLILASRAQQVYTTDIAPRCTHFAEFNRMLNGIENVIVRQGSFYEPVEGILFDLISCHPPFDFSLSSKGYVYADGGEDGESITRGAIAGLPQALKPGGQFLCACRVTDREDGPIEDRIRQWLGQNNAEFDIAVVVRSIVKIEEHAISASMRAKQNLDDYQEYMDWFKKLGVTQLPYVHVLIERKAQGNPVTLRRHVGLRCTSNEMAALLAWERAKHSLSVAGARLAASPHMELHVRHRFERGEVVPVEYKFVVEHPFHEEEPVPEWVAKLASLCIADRTTEQVYALMREEYPIGRDDFEAALKKLVSMAVLQLASGSSTISSN